MFKIVRTVVVASIALVTAGSVSAGETKFSGALCQPNSSNDASKVGYSGFGVHNAATTGAGVTCPAEIPEDGQVWTARVSVYDRHSTVDVCCNLLVQDPNGYIITSQQRCSQFSGSYDQVLVYNPPLIPFGHHATFACVIPGATAGGVSHVASYRLEDNR